MSFRPRIPAHLKREDEIQVEVVKFFRQLGCKVYTTSQRRRTDATPGLFDLYLVLPCRRGGAWFDTKQPDETLRAEQRTFAAAHQGSSVRCAWGTLQDAHRFAYDLGLITAPLAKLQ